MAANKPNQTLASGFFTYLRRCLAMQTFKLTIILSALIVLCLVMELSFTPQSPATPSPSPSAYPYVSGRRSVKQCLHQALRIPGVLERYVHWLGASTDGREAGAMQDCLRLSWLNIELLTAAVGDLSRAAGNGGPVSRRLVEETRSRLGAMVTNHQTCLDGLDSNAVELTAAIDSVSKMYDAALGLATEALANNTMLFQSNPGGGHRAAAQKPLDRFIEDLQKGLPNCISNSSTTCPKRYRISSEKEGKGVLVKGSIVVSKDGTGNFTTIAEAVKSAPHNLKPKDGYFVIYVKGGVYEEYIMIPRNKTNIMLIGDGINATIITGDHSVHANWTTYRSQTFGVEGDRFIGIGVTFRNTAGPEKDQAVAVRNNARNSSFYRCSFEGYQDTLYVHSNQQFYRECHIYGAGDFIFGRATAVFQQCTILARLPRLDQHNAITAHGREDLNHFTAISIHNCTIDAAPDLLAAGLPVKTYLGRPWKPYATTVVMKSYIGAALAPAGWAEYQGKLGLDTLYYGDYENYGPGADTSKRVQWPGYKVLNATEALKFTLHNLTQGGAWLPDTDIPFSAGL